LQLFEGLGRKKMANHTHQNSQDWLKAACDFINAAQGSPSLASVASHVGLSPSYFHKEFSHLLGISPRSFADAKRQQRLKQALLEGDDITGAIFEAGFGSSSRVYEFAKANFGMTPKTFKQGGKGQHIVFTCAQTDLGWLLLAATSLGLCSIELGDDKQALINRLKTTFHQAELQEGNEALAAWAQILVDYVHGQGPWPKLPYDIAATAFQRKVWEWLRTTEPGQTFSYSQAAVALGLPKAVRALASACARNPVALIIPCHRIVPKAGGVGQYRWHPARKQQILALEKNASRSL
jgi:AraC family transcriptional regulator of adaptative response/methylated-DNA-[protein]-cysteine methyltransferase